MTSGIYELTFPSGNTYIGKSIDVEERWKQHLDKLNKGKAAKNMQAEFNTYGKFSAKLLLEVHPDHIDIMEECYIARLAPVLNTVRCRDRLEGVHNAEFDYIVSFFNKSTVQHICEINRLDNKVDSVKAELDECTEECIQLKDEVADLLVKRSVEELEADVDRRLLGTEALLKLQAKQLQDIRNALDSSHRQNKILEDYRKLPWYKKIFN